MNIDTVFYDNHIIDNNDSHKSTVALIVFDYLSSIYVYHMDILGYPSTRAFMPEFLG